MSFMLQKQVCSRYGAAFSPPNAGDKLGITKNVGGKVLPINGLRHQRTLDTCGWYIWAGEAFSSDGNFFVPLHVEHLIDFCPEVMPFLALPPGYRFLIAYPYEDVWYDERLLETQD